MRYDLYFFVFTAVLSSGIFLSIPAFADSQVIIIPGAGTSKNCSETSTCFSPSILNVSPGDTVTWTNNDNVNHTVTSGLPYQDQEGILFDSGSIMKGKSFSFTFHDIGTYKYFDSIDKWMVGEVIVGNSEHVPICTDSLILQKIPCWKCSPGGCERVPEFGPLSELIILISIIIVITLAKIVKYK